MKLFSVAEETPRHAFKLDGLGITFAAIHLAVVSYVLLGWMMHSRILLFIYLLVLPMLALQWLINHGSSVVNNLENLARIGRWNDNCNELQGAFFKSLFRDVGLRLPSWSINIGVCALMLVFWLDAFWRMILIVPTP